MQFILNHLLQAGLTTTVLIVLIWILRKYWSSYLEQAATQNFAERNAYLAEKGKQSATKEDIEQITRQIESVRTEHLSLLELLKLELSKKGTIHRLRMEKEFETLTLAWDALAKLQFATEQLFPSGLQPRLESDQRRIQVEERANAFYQAYDACRNAIHKHKPFFPDDLDKVLFKILQTAQQVHAHFSNGINAETGIIPSHAYDGARPLLTTFHELLEDTSLRIKEHLDV